MIKLSNQKKGLNLLEISKLNRSLVLKTISNKQKCSRVEIAKETGLNQSTITKIVDQLLKLGIVHETGLILGKKGRRSIEIALNHSKYRVIGIRLSRKYFSSALFDISGNVYKTQKEKIKVFENPSMVLAKLKKTIEEYIKISLNEACSIIGIGVAVPGPFFKKEGRIGLMTEFPGWEDIFIEKELKESFDIPIYIENDANFAALAEVWFDNTNVNSLVYVLAGEGIGAGVVLDGKLFEGVFGSGAEIGHCSINYRGEKCRCGNNGCLELYCSTLSILKAIKVKLKDYPNSTIDNNSNIEDVFKAFRKEDPLAIEILCNAAECLGIGIVNIINAFNPETIVIGDALTQMGPRLIDIIGKVINTHTLPEVSKYIKIKLSSLKMDSALLGAGTLAIEFFLDNKY